MPGCVLALMTLQESMKLLRTHYRTIVRLAQEAPFSEIRLGFRELLSFLQALVSLSFGLLYLRIIAPLIIAIQKLDLPPVSMNHAQISYFFQPTQAPSEPADDTEVIRLLQDIFVRTGRVTHVDHVRFFFFSFFRFC